MRFMGWAKSSEAERTKQGRRFPLPRRVLDSRASDCRGGSRAGEDSAMRLLSDDELRALEPAEVAAFPRPVPTQIVSSDEYFPSPQSAEQARVEARVKALGDELGRRRGLSRRAFFRTASGMAAAYVAMNEVFGRYFDASLAEAADKDMAAERAKGLAGQFVMDTHTHFPRDDTPPAGSVP